MNHLLAFQLTTHFTVSQCFLNKFTELEFKTFLFNIMFLISGCTVLEDFKRHPTPVFLPGGFHG